MPAARRLFHLSIPVADLGAARAFYTDELRAEIGRETSEWIDVLLWGHQITLQLAPDSVSEAMQAKRHFGVVLPWDEWEREAARLGRSPALETEPVVKNEGESDEQAKLYLLDPSGNRIEVKAYRDFRRVLGTSDPNYETNS